jgi:serine protease Do
MKTLKILFQSAAVAALITAALALGVTAYNRNSSNTPPVALVTPSSAATVARPPIGAPAGLPDFADIAAQLGPAVVNISVSSRIQSGFPSFPQMNPDDPFYEFFRRFQPEAPHGSMPVQELGSGFIVSADGIILTNAHVVADADVVTVKLTDKREFKAKVIGLDKPSDVAVLKIEANNLPVVKIGDPQQARVGEWVIAIGSPFGFENSVTAGIVSAKSRSLNDEGYVPFLQTDVAVNPGNSGGPLCNTRGEVIGINSQIYSRSGGYQGVSFAIPIDVAMKVERQLIAHGKVDRGRLGVMIQEVSPQLAETFGLDKATGALVSSVEKGSAADKAGIEPGDVILKFNGKEISRSAELPPLVSELIPGTAARLQLWHKGKAKDITLNLGEMKTAVLKEKSDRVESAKLGLAVRPLTQEERKEADVIGGVVVENVNGASASRAGIRQGDVILAVNGENIASVEALRNVLAKHNKHVALLILRGNQKMYVPVNLG